MISIFQKSLQLPIKVLKNYSKLSCVSRTFSTTSKILKGNYEGDGKTTVSIINRDYKHLVMVDTISRAGFRLNNGIFAIGPMAAFPKTILQWNVNSIAEMTPESLSLFCLLDPKLDILVIGSGDKKELPNKNVLDYLKSNKIATEILPTHDACSIFNFLNAEGRYVAGAFIPPPNVQLYEDEAEILETVEAIDDYSTPVPPKIP